MHRWCQSSIFCTSIYKQAANPKNARANVLAAELLMPLDKIKHFAKLGLDIKKLPKCTQKEGQSSIEV
ncbi:MAG: hypothetical protein K0R55_187 [Sporomusa sp.]|jgi:Zn-dependent peptidase ImmA (M78 family)|nr:hypothetical protein [Sporomusa sp.]